jgi:hypothetical protein
MCSSLCCSICSHLHRSRHVTVTGRDRQAVQVRKSTRQQLCTSFHLQALTALRSTQTKRV